MTIIALGVEDEGAAWRSFDSSVTSGLSPGTVASLHATRIATGEGSIHVTCLGVEPRGIIGTHPAPVPQMFLVTAGEGWIAGPDGERVPIAAGAGVRWEQGEVHTSGTDVGFTAIAIEGAAVELFKPAGPGD